MQGFWRRASSCSAALVLAGCSAATQAAFVPQLDLGLRSSRSLGARNDRAGARHLNQRWDLTVFARLAWSSRRSANLIPSRVELSPDTWIDPYADQACIWDNADQEATSAPSEQAP